MSMKKKAFLNKFVIKIVKGSCKKKFSVSPIQSFLVTSDHNFKEKFHISKIIFFFTSLK